MLFKKAVKPACEVLVTTATNEVKTLVAKNVDDAVDGLDIVEGIILGIGLIASFVLPHNPIARIFGFRL